MDKRIEFRTFAVGERNNERAGGILGVVSGYRLEAFALLRNLDHLASANQFGHCLACFGLRIYRPLPFRGLSRCLTFSVSAAVVMPCFWSCSTDFLL